MPDAKKHKIIGTMTGGTLAYAYGHYIAKEPSKAWQYGLSGSIGGHLFSRLPDILEPSKVFGPDHRGLFHGIVFNGSIATLGFKRVKQILDTLVGQAKESDISGKPFQALVYRSKAGAIVGAASGYASHLLADFRTPKGLPLVGQLKIAKE